MVNKTVIFTISGMVLFSLVDNSKKVIKANTGNESMVLKNIPEAIQKAGNLESD